VVLVGALLTSSSRYTLLAIVDYVCHSDDCISSALFVLVVITSQGLPSAPTIDPLDYEV
jgi:hypothetical protein